MKVKISYIILISFFMSLSFVDCKDQKNREVIHDRLTTEDKEAILNKGNQIAVATFAALSSELKKALNEGGVLNAIEYCNLAALSITDSLATQHNARIKRTSLKVRNTINKPSLEEERQLISYASQLEAGSIIKSEVKQIDENSIAFYAPIFISDFCLKCHGEIGKTLSFEDHDFIKSKYPRDLATGYQAGDLRGIWSIQFVR